MNQKMLRSLRLSGHPHARRVRLWAATAATVTIAGTAAVAGMDHASAALGPGLEKQFIQITTHGSPIWKATMVEYDNITGSELWSWSTHGDRHGGKATVWHDRIGNVQVDIESVQSDLQRHHWRGITNLNMADGQCILIDHGGEVRFTGDSATGGCTPN